MPHVPVAYRAFLPKVCEYWADFSYWPKEKGLVVEDVKGVETDAFVIKRKLLKAVYGLDVVIVR